MNNLAIGFIDSGVGGLTVVKEALRQLPNETVYYVGDTARCPYGPRPVDQVRAFTWEMTHFLLEKGIKMLVIACNTATAAALSEIKEALDIPVVGVIKPGSRAAIKATANHHIGIIGTQGTVKSDLYRQTILASSPKMSVESLACPKFVPLVESNEKNVALTQKVVQESLAPLQNRGLDTLILGCTHYPIIRDTIQKVMGPEVTLIDSGKETIGEVAFLLDHLKIAHSEKINKDVYYTTGSAKMFDEIAQNWLDLPHLKSQHIDLGVKKLTPSKKSEQTVVVATRNIGKAREFEKMFAKKGLKTKTLLDYAGLPEIEETGTTFEENARLKAETIAKILNLPVLADDSGLMVDALHGQPGIFSARFAEDHNDAANNAKLLHELYGVAPEERTAKFHCTLALARPHRESLVVEGETQGLIIGVPRGDNGFGYDPLFYLPEYEQTFAQMSDETKNAISHRARAVASLEEKFDDWWDLK